MERKAIEDGFTTTPSGGAAPPNAGNYTGKVDMKEWEIEEELLNRLDFEGVESFKPIFENAVNNDLYFKIFLEESDHAVSYMIGRDGIAVTVLKDDGTQVVYNYIVKNGEVYNYMDKIGDMSEAQVLEFVDDALGEVFSPAEVQDFINKFTSDELQTATLAKIEEIDAFVTLEKMNMYMSQSYTKAYKQRQLFKYFKNNPNKPYFNN